jgi:hypothetical protein
MQGYSGSFYCLLTFFRINPEQTVKVRELYETFAEYYTVKSSESEANTEAKEEG